MKEAIKLNKRRNQQIRQKIVAAEAQIHGTKEPTSPGQAITVEKAVFVGTTKELQELMLKKNQPAATDPSSIQDAEFSVNEKV